MTCDGYFYTLWCQLAWAAWWGPTVFAQTSQGSPAWVIWLLCQWGQLDYSCFCMHSQAPGPRAAYIDDPLPPETPNAEWGDNPLIVQLTFSMAKELFGTHLGLHQYSKPCKAWSLFLEHSSHGLSKSSLHSYPFLKSLNYFFPNVLN